MSTNHGLPDQAVNDILRMARSGYPTIIPGAIVFPTHDECDLQVITIDEACEIIRAKAMPAQLAGPNSLRMVMAMGNRYQWHEA